MPYNTFSLQEKQSKPLSPQTQAHKEVTPLQGDHYMHKHQKEASCSFTEFWFGVPKTRPQSFSFCSLFKYAHLKYLKYRALYNAPLISRAPSHRGHLPKQHWRSQGVRLGEK